jgi:tetratricopeptide (TPR) repeat protein
MGSGTVWDGIYTIEETLGKGAMGVVYRARDRRSGKDVALKVLSSRRLSQKARIRLQREGELTAALRHPGIVGIHSAGEVAGVPYLAYELVPKARTLEDVLGRTSRQRGVVLIRDAAEALGFAHQHGVIHRDVKPANILVDARGKARVADFGLARAEGADALTRSGDLVGTPSYMAPEQLAGKNRQVGAHTDVWALGVILYEHLVGERPFQGETFVQLTAMVWEGSFKAPRQIDPSVPRDLEAICLKCLHNDETKRYPSGTELAEDLSNALAHRPVTASSHVLVRFRVPKAWKWAALAVAGLILVAGLAFLGWRVLDARLAASARQEALREALAAYQAGSGEGGELAGLLGQDDTSPAELRARVHLALAGSSARSWAEREAHAREAVALDAALAGEAARPLAEALRWQGRADEAAEAFAEALRQGGGDELLLDKARALLEARDPAAAATAAQDYLDSHRYEPAGLEVLGLAQVAVGELQAARDTVASLHRLHPGPESAVLSARLREAEGGDPFPLLADAVERWPGKPKPAVALAGLLLGRASAPAAAHAILERAASRGARSPELERLLRVTDAVLATPPRLDALRSAPPSLRATAVSALWLEGRRALGILRRLRDPRFEQSPRPEPGRWTGSSRQWLRAAYSLADEAGERARIAVDLAEALGPGAEAATLLDAALEAGQAGARVRCLRARCFLLAGRPELALTALEAVDQGPEAYRLRGQALVQLGRADEARRWLERGFDAERLDELALDEAARVAQQGGLQALEAELRERLAILRGGQAEEAERLFQTSLDLREDKSAEDLMAEGEAILSLNPRHAETRLKYAELRVIAKSDPLKGLREMLALGKEVPLQLGNAWLGMTLFAKAGAQRFRAINLGELRQELDPAEPEQRLLWALLNAAAVHAEGREDWIEPGLRVLDQVVVDDPGEHVAWLLRGMHNLWAGRTELARHDLRLASEAAPGSGIVVFQQAMVEAEEGAGPARVLKLLLEARDLDYSPYTKDESWSVARYPMLERFRGVKELDFLFVGSR